MKSQTFPTLSEKQPSIDDIQIWMATYIAELLNIQLDEIELALPFDRFGLDSSAAVGMTGDLEDWIGLELDPTLLYDYPTITALAQHLGSELESQV